MRASAKLIKSQRSASKLKNYEIISGEPENVCAAAELYFGPIDEFEELMQVSQKRLRAQLKQAIREAFPSLWVHWHLLRRPCSAEAELSLVGNIVGPQDTTVDVGANIGLYTRALARMSCKVHAFEPSAELASILRRTSARNVIIHDIALSDRDGQAELRVPCSGSHLAYGLASLEKNAVADENFVAVDVHVARLDSIVRDDVTFVKIDVEGHELNVLRGAQGLIERCQPAFLVEAEERHRIGATASVFNFFRERNYDGFFVRGSDIIIVDEFDAGADQDEAALLSDGGRQDGCLYVNNFFFFPASCDGRGILTGS